MPKAPPKPLQFDAAALANFITPEFLEKYPEAANPEELIAATAFFNAKERRKIAAAIPMLEQLASSSEAIEREGALAWVKRFFPQTFTRDFTSYQREFWEWGWDIQPDTYYRPRVECAPRGAGKSSSAETWVVMMLAKNRRKAIGYVSGTDDKANKHFNSIKRKLENDSLLRTYPHLRPSVQKYRNAFNSWSQDRLVTQGGQTIIPITLQGSNRGFKSEDDTRFDLIIYDDIDSLGESPDLIAKNLDLLKSEIVLAGYANTLHVVFQNLIHRDSIVTQILDHRADMFSDRDFRGPFPLLKWYDAEKVDLPDGGKRWVITDGEVHDPALDKTYCESILNQIGKDLFDRESQQEVWKVGDDKDFREWDEVYHVITRSEMRAGFPQVNLGDTYQFKIPNRWHVGRGLDWGTTRQHPAVNCYVTRPDKTCPHDDAHFIIGEVVMPRFPYDAHIEAEVVSPGRVAYAAKVFQERFGIIPTQIEQSKMSHEASAALNTMVIDLPDDLKQFYNKWKAQKGSGVPQIQNMLEIDRTKPHPFRRYPEGHAQAGQPIMGCPRIFVVVADGQGELYLDVNHKLRVKGAVDAEGMARLRFEMPLYSHRNQGQKKIDDDAVDALRGLMATFGVQSDALTYQEEVVAATPEKYRWETIRGANYSPEKEMAVRFQEELAKRKAASAIQHMVTFNEFGEPKQEDFIEAW